MRALQRCKPWITSHRRLLTGGTVILLAFLAVLAGPWLRSWYLVQREIARIRAAGEPVSPQDLRALYHSQQPDEQANAQWQAAFDAVEQWTRGRDLEGVPFFDVVDLPKKGDPWPEREELEKLLLEASPVIAHLQAATKSGKPFSGNLPFENGFAMLTPQIANVRAGVWVLLLQAHVAMHRGDHPQTTDSLLAALAVARVLEPLPTVVSTLVRARCDKYVAEEIAALLGSAALEDEDLERLQAVLRGIRYEENMRRALWGNRVAVLLAFRDSNTAYYKTSPRLWKWKNAPRQWQALAMSRRLLSVTQRPWPDMLREANAVDAEAERMIADDQASWWAWVGLPRTWGVPEIVQVDAFFFRGMAAHTAVIRAADTLISVERFRRARGRMPERLDDLVPEFLPAVPQDPFTGQPLRFIVAQDDHMVYSVGKDGIDQQLEPLKDDAGLRVPPRVIFNANLPTGDSN